MTFDVFYPFNNKAGALCPGIYPKPMELKDILELCNSPEHRDKIAAVRNAQTKQAKELAKKNMEAVVFVGHTTTTRRADAMQPTGFVMVDFDHCTKDPSEVWKDILEKIGNEWLRINVLCAHTTVSGEGLRVVFIAQKGKPTLLENMRWFGELVDASQFCQFDLGVYDFGRLSFLPLREDFLYINPDMLEIEGFPQYETDLRKDAIPAPVPKQGNLFSEEEQIGDFTEEEVAKFDGYEYKGHKVKEIVDKWVNHRGEPSEGEKHNYYNEMVKYFRNIVSNNGRALLYLLPRFGHSKAECWSQIQSITRVNTLSSLPKPFYFFLKDNGFLDRSKGGSLDAYMLQDEPEEAKDNLPPLPPVFREYVKICPKDFRVSMVNALLPIMGTLTSYLEAKYYYDNRLHTTSFFSVIYAPPGTGKGFVERCMELLFEEIRIRDYVQSAREKLYLDVVNRKGDNEKAPEDPHTSLRIIPPKNSEAEFLNKQRDNHGYHMFTYAAEMDSWAKGVRAAGGNKDDMIRIAWDNGKYGQQFKGVGTFKGEVNLYWNVLITGTIQQLLTYFKNVENGLITRCSFTSIENQEYAAAPIWKELSKKDISTIRKFMARCDTNTYEEPCDILKEDVDFVTPSKFDEEIDWRFKFKQRKTVDMAWLKPTIDAFLDRHLKKAALDLDKARDVFRRRVAVRGFRLGMMCYALWERPREKDLRSCIPFIDWWMEKDLESSLGLWGARYNTETETAPNLYQRSIYSQLSPTFTKEDVYSICKRQNILSPVRTIIYQWTKLGYVKKVGKNEYEKTGKA